MPININTYNTVTIKVCLCKYALGQGSSTFWVRGPIYNFHIILRAAVIADYKIIMDILNIIIGAWAARQVTYMKWLWRRWSNGRTVEWAVAAQLIFQPFRRFAYVTAHSTALPLFHLRHWHLTYVTAHSPILPPLYLHYSSFYNPSIASPTS